jgi:hypothetical protein
LVPPPRLTWPQVWAHRAARHGLTVRRPAAELHALVADLCGLHAQVMSSAELTARARLEDLDPAAIRRALWEDRTLYKTWAMRGTLHLLPTREFNLWTAALSTNRRHGSPSWLKGFKVTPDEYDTLQRALEDALEEPITREELARRMPDERTAELVRGSWGPFLKPAAFRGRLCFADSEGSNVRFVRPGRWLATTRELVDPEAALEEVVTRYLRMYGPATRESLSRWLGWWTPAQARRRIEALDVTVVDVEGREAYVLTEDLGSIAAAEPQGVVRALPQFDVYVVGAWRDQPDVAPQRELIYRQAGWLSAVILIDGRISATWTKDGIAWFGTEPAARKKAAAAEIERLIG